MALEHTTRLVVSSRGATGFGDLLVSLSSAWQYARRTNRTLVIDWRRSLYVRNQTRNAFPVFFEPISAIDGVPVVCDDAVGPLSLRAPVYSALGNRGSTRPLAVKLSSVPPLRHIPQVVAFRNRLLHRAQRDEKALVVSGTDVPERTVLLERCLPTELSKPEVCQRFLDYIKPVNSIQREIDSFTNEYFHGKRVIAVHVRYASATSKDNNHSRYWLDESLAVATICSAVQRLKDKLGDGCLVFLCTDVARIVPAVRALLDNVVTRNKYFRPDDRSELHKDRAAAMHEGSRLARDTVVEMFLLAKADALVCYPPDSFFSFYARYCRNGPPLRETDSLRNPRAISTRTAVPDD